MKVTCSADQLLNSKEEDRAHLEIKKERDISSSLMGLTFLKFQITGGMKSLFGKSKTTSPVWLSVEDAKRVRKELDEFIEAHEKEWEINEQYAQHPTEPIPNMKMMRKHNKGE